MKKELSLADRLIVAADFKPTHPNGREWARSQVLALADSLSGTGVYLKVNSILRANDYSLIGEIQSCGLKVFADLKLIDIDSTLSMDGVLLREAKPEILTVMCLAGVTAMKALKVELPDTEILGVTVLTNLKENEAREMFGTSIATSVMKFVHFADDAGIDGLICAPKENVSVHRVMTRLMTINNPGIRPEWAIVPGDDQNQDRVMTPTQAIATGADRIVVGRPITKPSQGMTPHDAVMRTLEEIDQALNNK